MVVGEGLLKAATLRYFDFGAFTGPRRGNMLSNTYYWYFLQLAPSKIKKFVVKIYIPQSAESFAIIYKALSSTVLMWDRMKVISYFSELVKKLGFRFLKYKKLTNLFIALS